MKKNNYYIVELEVAVRKYPVDTERLVECLISHKRYTNQEIADRLNKPKSLVDHWFRRDEWFAIPDADIWFDLKSLLGIETDEFDESVTTFEVLGGVYDMRNRIYIGDTAPTLSQVCGNYLYLIQSAAP